MIGSIQSLDRPFQVAGGHDCIFRRFAMNAKKFFFVCAILAVLAFACASVQAGGKHRHWSWRPGISSTPVLLSIPISRVCGACTVLLSASSILLLSASTGILPTGPSICSAGICAAGPRICTTKHGLFAAPDIRATGSAGAAHISNSAPIAESGNAACVSAARRAAVLAPAVRCESFRSAVKRQSITDALYSSNPCVTCGFAVKPLAVLR